MDSSLFTKSATFTFANRESDIATSLCKLGLRVVADLRSKVVYKLLLRISTFYNPEQH